MILDGKIVAADIKQRLREEIHGRMDVIGRRPKLVIISVGDDAASKVYVRNKMKAAEEVGIEVKHIVFDGNIKNKCDVITTIWYYNDDDDVDGIMVQLPLPEGWDDRAIIDVI